MLRSADRRRDVQRLRRPGEVERVERQSRRAELAVEHAELGVEQRCDVLEVVEEQFDLGLDEVRRSVKPRHDFRIAGTAPEHNARR